VVAVDGYEIRKVLGRGGFAEVFLAEDERLGRLVALKVPLVSDPDQLDRFARECRTAARLDGHPNVIRLFHSNWTKDGKPYLAMEYLRDGALDLKVGPRPLPRVLEVIGQIAAALTVAHKAGIIHRDVKPGNILAAGGSTVKLSDFGIAGALPDEGELGTTTGRLYFSVAYAAPEALWGERVDDLSDLYQLGRTMYALLSGSDPSGRLADTSALDVPPQVSRFMESLMAPDPTDRPKSARQVAQRLNELQEELGLRVTELELDWADGIQQPKEDENLASEADAPEADAPATDAPKRMTTLYRTDEGSSSPNRGLPGTGLPGTPPTDQTEARSRSRTPRPAPATAPVGLEPEVDSSDPEPVQAATSRGAMSRAPVSDTNQHRVTTAPGSALSLGQRALVPLLILLVVAVSIIGAWVLIR